MAALLALPAFLSRIPLIAWALLAVAVLLMVTMGQCEKRRNAAAESKLERAQGKAAVESGRDAVETVSSASERERASEDVGRQNERIIRNADGSSEIVRPGVGNAGLDSLCRRAAYRNSERCRVRVSPAR